MTVTSAKFISADVIEAVIDGATLNVPNDFANRHRREIADSGVTLVPWVPRVSTDEVNRERERRIVEGATWNGIRVTGTPDDARNLTNLALAAQMRVAQGGSGIITNFRDGDNVDHALDQTEVLALWAFSASFVETLYAASWALKAMDPIPLDYADDKYWDNIDD